MQKYEHMRVYPLPMDINRHLVRYRAVLFQKLGDASLHTDIWKRLASSRHVASPTGSRQPDLITLTGAQKSQVMPISKPLLLEYCRHHVFFLCRPRQRMVRGGQGLEVSFTGRKTLGEEYCGDVGGGGRD